MFASMINRPNNVRAKQIAFQAEKNVPVYLRGKGKYYYPACIVFLGLSLGGSCFQLIQYTRGKAKKSGE